MPLQKPKQGGESGATVTQASQILSPRWEKATRQEKKSTLAPSLLIARPMPDAVLARAKSNHTVTDNQENADWAQCELAARAADFDAIMTAPGAALSTAVIEALPDSVRIAATFSVGYDHIDLEAAKGARSDRHQHA